MSSSPDISPLATAFLRDRKSLISVQMWEMANVVFLLFISKGIQTKLIICGKFAEIYLASLPSPHLVLSRILSFPGHQLRRKTIIPTCVQHYFLVCLSVVCCVVCLSVVCCVVYCVFEYCMLCCVFEFCMLCCVLYTVFECCKLCCVFEYCMLCCVFEYCMLCCVLYVVLYVVC